MKYSETLPFGNTKITEREYRDQVHRRKAVELLERSGTKDAERCVENFVERVLDVVYWLEENGEEYPWRYTTDPWEVYVAEILLQRTRGNAVAENYRNFVERFPDPSSLNIAEEGIIEEYVEGLGLENRRVKTLQSVGKIFTKEFDNNVPRDSESLKRPWRVGDYVAEATRLFSYGKSTVLVDANIANFFEDILDYPMPDAPHKDKQVSKLVNSLKPEKPSDTRAFYLAIIDYDL